MFQGEVVFITKTSPCNLTHDRIKQHNINYNHLEASLKKKTIHKTAWINICTININSN